MSDTLTHEDWIAKWHSDETTWDLGGIHPGSSQLWSEWKTITGCDPSSTVVLMPGAGRAHDARLFLNDRSQVIACDLSSVARADAVATLHHPNLSYHVGDLFEFHPKHMTSMNQNKQVDVIFDRAVLCAFHDQLRVRYVRWCAQQLESKKWFISIPFVRLSSGSETPYPHQKTATQPPFFLTVDQILDVFSSLFDLVWMSPYPSPLTSPNPYGEYLMIWQRS